MDREFLRRALLGENYFPNHRTKSRELPPFFHTRNLTPQVASDLIAAGVPTAPYKGCDYVPYTLTRFNGGPRVCGIPHPFAYCTLVQRIYDSWPRLAPSLITSSSVITPRQHPDGRLFIMDYGSHRAKSDRYLKRQSCASFTAHADISNFYPSLYTHAIPWAIVGIDAAKQNTNNNLWYNALDRDYRNCRRQETNGVSIGPGTSSIASEFILCRIDRRRENRYNFDRFIDDYTAYTSSLSEAKAFLRDLEIELARFNLYLNFNKSSIKALPGVELPNWIDDLRISSIVQDKSFYNIKMFISRAITLADRHPEGSVLRYALHALADEGFSQSNGDYVLQRVLGLAASHLHLVSCIKDLIPFGMDRRNRFKYKAELLNVLQKAALSRRSDAMCWALHLCRESNTSINREIENDIFQTFDCLSLVMLYEVGSPYIRGRITHFVRARLLNRAPSTIQRNWMLIHYLLNAGVLTRAEVSDNTLLQMQALRVNLFN